MMPLYGMPALIEYEGLEPNLRLCEELELDFVELNMNMPYSFPEKIPRDRIRAAVRDGMRFSMHLHDELDLGSLHRSVRAGHLDRCLEALRWGADNGVWLLNLHLNPGVYFTLPDRKVWVYERYLEQYIASLSDSLALLSQEAEALDVRICLENTGHLSMGFMRRAVEEAIAMPSIGLCWDIGHDARSGNAEEDFMLAHLDRVWHMHFHDYDGRSDHQLPFTGRIDCSRFLGLARENDMSVLVEVKTEQAVRQAVATLRDRGLLPCRRSLP